MFARFSAQLSGKALMAAGVTLAMALLSGTLGCGGKGNKGGSDGGVNQDAAQGRDGATVEDGGSNNNNTQAGLCGASEGQLFDESHAWNQRVDTAPLDGESATIIGYLNTQHTDSQRFRIDGPSSEPDNQYGITLLYADSDTIASAFTPTGDHFSPDCDITPVPLPTGGAIEGEAGYGCEGDGDCHLLVIDPSTCRLYEMWRANITSTTFFGGCLAVWFLDQTYSPVLRGDCCTSADAAGLPIAALMFGADDIAAGEILHALRFILPNALMRERVYVRPATHSTGATSGPADAPPYGARLRLKADFDPSGLNPAARVVAVALQRYGMILADGGNITFTALNDRFTTHTWAQVGLGPNDLTSLRWTDFEVVELGTRYLWDGACNCDRTPIIE